MGVAKVIDEHAEKVGSVQVCTLKSASEPLFLEMGALGFPRNSPIKRLFDRMTVWMRNTGLKSEPRPTCLKPNLQQGRKPIEVLQVSGVVALWAAGIVLGISVFGLEVLVPSLGV
nr:uncharacterized protein LOC113805771 [Penaeus vannamei]